MEWMKAGGGAWHGGRSLATAVERAVSNSGSRCRLTPSMAPAESIYLAPASIPRDGPARVLLGSYERGGQCDPSAITSELPLRPPGGRRTVALSPPEGQTVCSGRHRPRGRGDLRAIARRRPRCVRVIGGGESSSKLEATANSSWVRPPRTVTSSLWAPTPVHTNPDALHAAESRIAQIRRA